MTYIYDKLTARGQFTQNELEILAYCKPHLQQMWVSYIASVILKCDFQDAARQYERLGL